MRMGNSLFIVVASLLTVGCVRTIHPILNDDQVIVDQTLTGLWVGDDGKETADVKPPGDDKKYAVVYTDKDGKKSNLVVRLGKVGDLFLAEITAADPDAGDMYKFHLLPMYSFLVIQQTAPHLKFSMMSQDWIVKYLEAHPKELEVLQIRHEESVITSSTEDFQAFLLKHWKDKDALGDKPGMLVRPGDPTTRPTDAAK